MGCVQSLFNPSKPGPVAPPPEREFVPPTFETVVVTRQPKTQRPAGGGEASEVEEGGDVATKRDDDDFDEDDRSIHYVEATAVRTLAANTGSVAILGTTAKCRSLVGGGDDDSPTRFPPDRQSTWPSSSSSGDPTPPANVQLAQVETRYVEATAVRTLAAETGSIAILGTTADPKPRQANTATNEESGSVHYVEATAVRHLAAETGTIAILASTAAAAATRPRSEETVDDDDDGSADLMIPVGVREVLDAEQPADETAKRAKEEAEEQEEEEEGTPPRQADGDETVRTRETIVESIDPPLPVAHATEMKPDSRGAGNAHKALSFSPSSDKRGLPPRSMTAATGGASPAGPSFEAFTRKPLVRQTREPEEEPDDRASDRGWLPAVPVFAKCPPAKSKSLPAKNAKTAEPGEPQNDDDDGERCGVSRGSSLPVSGTSQSTVRDERPLGEKADEPAAAAVRPNEADGPEAAAVRPNEADEPTEPFGRDSPRSNDTDRDAVAPAASDGIGPSSPDVGGTSSADVGGTSPDVGEDSAEEYRLTMIQSVREAVNRICEQAVEKSAAIAKSRGGQPADAAAATPLEASGRDGKRDSSVAADRDDSEISEFSLPPPPPPPPAQPGADSASIGQELSWPPPPLESEEERTIAPGFSFDLPDPPTDMDQMDSETDRMDISDEEMRATTGLPSDEEDKTETETTKGGGDAMKPTAATVARDGAAAAEPANAHSADDRAATTIQAVYRGFRARKYVETVHAAAAKIQAGFRGYRVRQSLKNHAAPPSTTDDSQCWSEDDDQKSVVSVAHRPPPPPAADAAECGRDEGAGTLPVPAADAVLTSAAVKIQARVRGFAARKRLNGDRNGKLQ